MATYLITGGAGFIGSHIAELALSLGHRVIVLDDLSTGRLNNLKSMSEDANFSFVEADICAPKTYQHVMQDIDHIIHCAAKISVAESVESPELYEKVNVEGTRKLLDLASEYNVKSFVLSSSAAVYGDNPLLPKTEAMLAEPKSPYADNKLKDEELLAAYADQGTLRTVALRYFNVFGPKQDPHSPYAAAMPHFISQAVQHKEIAIFGDGEQTRDFIFVADIAKANLLASQSGSGVYNVANGGAITITELAEKIKAHLSSDSKIVYGPERAGDIKHSRADVSRLKLQWPEMTLTDFNYALGQTIDYYTGLTDE
jgi:UDP-glucose 4-epimerase